MNTEKKYTRFKLFSLILAFTLLLTDALSCVTVAQAEDTQAMPQASIEPSVINTPEPSIEPGYTNTPEPSAEPENSSTPEPSAEPEITSTPEASPAPENTSSPKPSASPSAKPVPKLKQVKGVCLTRYSTHSIKVTWKKHKKAGFYRVYYSKNKNGSGYLAGITKNTQYMVNKLKNNTSYYFYVVACKAKKASDSDSSPSDKVHIRTKTYIRKTIFAGDSITKGITDYGRIWQTA